jgi:hypothetical protein
MEIDRNQLEQLLRNKRALWPERTLMENIIAIVNDSYASGHAAGWREGWDRGFADGYTDHG